MVLEGTLAIVGPDGGDVVEPGWRGTRGVDAGAGNGGGGGGSAEHGGDCESGGRGCGRRCLPRQGNGGRV